MAKSARTSASLPWSEKVYVAVLFMMGLTALIMEPLFYYNHPQWHQAGAPDSVPTIMKIWDIYLQWDPLFAAPPDWLQVLCWIEVLCFGPLYFISAYAIYSRQRALQRAVVMPFCGALFYSTVVYFSLEFLNPLPSTNLLMVFLINCPWTFLPFFLFFHIGNQAGMSFFSPLIFGSFICLKEHFHSFEDDPLPRSFFFFFSFSLAFSSLIIIIINSLFFFISAFCFGG